jgi:hypothetical protein
VGVAASVACQRSTSHRISAARCRAGRCCSAVTNASRIVSRATATSAGSALSGSTSLSGIGETQAASGSQPPRMPIEPSAEFGVGPVDGVRSHDRLLALVGS